MLSSEFLTISALIVLFLCFLLAPLWLNRNELPPGESQNKCNKHVTDPQNDPRLIQRPNDDIKIIRVTNSGEFVDRCELTDALYELNWDREWPKDSFGARANPEAKKLPKLAVLYVHGWKHDASTEDTDLKNFTQLILDLRERHKGEKYVVGIYLGWNASAGLPGFLENVSFWVKKSNADRIAQSAVVTKIVSAIGSVTKGARGRVDQFIALGHSFGARIIFSAAAQSLVYETERAHPGFPGGEYRMVEGPADGIILLNPAFEASRYTAIDDITRKDERFKASQPPLLISISTINDWATRRAFPIGQYLGLARSQRELTTLGNYSPYLTHTLAPAAKGSTVASDVTTENFTAAGLSLARLARGDARRVVQSRNPFVVARTTKAVINGHNGIWGPNFRVWLTELIAEIERCNERREIPPESNAESKVSLA